MTLSTFDTIFYTFSFIVPGFILHSTLTVFVPQKAEQPQLSFLRFLTLSCVNYAIWSWLIYLIFRSNFFINHPFRTSVAWGTIVLISPVVLGILGGHFSQKEIIRKALQAIGLKPIHVIPTAWDYTFNKIQKAVWILVTLKDESTVAGLFGSKSFASSEIGKRDLFIQEIFKISGDGPWQRISRSAGILIKEDQIKHIEFWEDVEEENNV